MSPVSLKQYLVGSLLSGFAAHVSATPITGANSQYADQVLRRRALLDIRHTTTTNNTKIDWIPLESQGKIATPPPVPHVRIAAVSGHKPLPELHHPEAELGPEGTVPIPQISAEYLARNVPKSPPPTQSAEGQRKKRQYSGKHWYSASNQGVANLGGSAIYSMFKAYVANNNDFSLLQTAVVKSNTNGGQSVEVGWINFPGQIAQPHLFTFYTTNGWGPFGDNRGGWNRDVAGWVQVDNTIFPGTVFSTLSTDGGPQYEIQLKTYLYQGNWWVWVMDRWIGYYPASLFSNGISGTTLATGSDVIHQYGEIYQSEGPMTTTDMGSGKFANTGFGHSAYIRKMFYNDMNAVEQEYTAGWWDDDSNRYSHANGRSDDWGRYAYLGGPGAGGVTGG